MAKLTLDSLMRAGLSKEAAVAVLQLQEAPAPRLRRWTFRATEDEASQIAVAFPHITIEQAYRYQAKGKGKGK